METLQVSLASGILVVFVINVVSANSTWYRNGVIYHLYLRSFKDTDGDGIGDLKGIVEKLDYLLSLNIDAVAFSSIYPSPNEDYGYDILDYFSINPEYGTMQQFKYVVRKLKERGVRVIMDFIPNHSSTHNEWFIKSESRNNTYEKYSDFYVWKDPKEYDENNNPMPPNNWLSVMGAGSAWKWSEKRKQFYLHNFFEGEAEHNFRSPEVHKKMEDVLRFWMDLGVSGFKVNTISWIYEDQEFLDEPKSETYDQYDPYNYSNLIHRYTIDLPQNIEYVKQLRSFVDEYTESNNLKESKFLILESYSPMEKVVSYYGDEDHPGATPVNFALFKMTPSHSSADWEENIKHYYSLIGKNDPNWVIGNHDWKRVATRWSEEWVDLLHILMLTLRGTAVTYYGEELGLEDNIIRWDQVKDVQGKLAGKEKFMRQSRDFQRAPFPWDNSHSGGFTSAPQSWIPLAPSYWWRNQKTQEIKERSHLKVYRALTKLRKEPTMISGDCDVKGTSDLLLYVVRSLRDNPTIVSVINIGDIEATANLKNIRPGLLPDSLKIVVSSINYPNYSKSELNTTDIVLPPKSGIVVST